MSRALPRLVSRCARTFENLIRFRERYQPRPTAVLGVDRLEARETPSVGGGFTDQGLTGTYYSDNNFTTAAFTRKDVRLDFNWDSTIRPGGSTSPGYRDVGTDNFSARWGGQLIPRFSETYTFSGFADDVFKLEIKPAGPTAYTTVVDQTANTGVNFSGTYAMTAGQRYDVRISFREFTGNAAVRLLWSSPSTPAEVIDPVNQSGINNPDSRAAFTDIVKGARNSWEPIDGGPRPGTDANGWPTGNGSYVFQESLNQGLDVDPLTRGRVQFSFTGRADVSVWGNVEAASLTSTYTAGTNTTSGSFLVANKGINASYFQFRNSTRTGVTGGPGGITDLKLLMPRVPDATANNYTAGEQFTTNIKDAMSKFTVVRHQYVANQQKEWADRTRPGYFNQGGGSRTAATYPLGYDTTSDNGWSWEHKVMLANETGRDLMLSTPPLASNDYLTRLANLLRYGSDGVNPYTAPTANPVYPPLNPNLRAYLEIGNELWNFAGVFYVDYNNINQLTTNANAADRAAITYDGVTDLGTTRYRYIMLRTKQISDIFRGVYGNAAMPGNGNNENARVRPVYEWQYDNLNGTADRALPWADRYFNKTDPASTYAGAAVPVNSYLWGGGGATYYGATNGNGLTDRVPNSGFDATSVPAGYTQNPTGTSWTFTGTAGIARTNGSDIPPAFNAAQMGYVTDTGRMQVSFTVPATQTSNVYAVAFKALNRKKAGASDADKQTLRAYLDYGTANQVDITAKTYSQGNGYTPPSYDQIPEWKARNVFWTDSEYYYTKSFNLAAGSTHTITLVGQGDISGTGLTNQAAFVEDVRLTSVDAIFAGGIPGGGEATGQPAGQNIRNTMNVSSSWAAAFGLKHLAYESGWSLGGDDGGSYVQLKAKYGDARTADAQRRFMDYYAEAGGEVNVFGTYAQWPNWGDFYAEQGLLNVGSYPIMQGVQNRSDNLEAEATNGQFLTGTFDRTAVTLSDTADRTAGRITAAGGWFTWNVIAPRSGRYVITANTGSGGALALLADDAQIAAGTSGGAVSGTVFLTKGLHTLKVRSTSGAFNVTNVVAVGEAAPASPTLTGLSETNGTAAVTWNSVSGATGYVVRYGIAPGKYDQRIDVGNATSRSIPGLANDTAYYFVVSAYNAAGAESLPSAPRAVIALGDGVTGDLGRWEFTGLASGGAVVPSPVAPRATGDEVTVGPLAFGPGLLPGNDWVTQYFPDRFSGYANGNVWGTSLADAVTRNQFYQFTVAPVAGRRLSLSALNFQAWFSDGGNPNIRVGLRYSTDGTNFTDAPLTGTIGAAAGLTADLSGIAALQNGTGTVTFRIYTWGANTYTATGIGLGTAANDLVVRGSTTPASSGLGTFTTAGDIGGPGVAGGSSFNSGTGTYTVTGGGNDIWGTSDQFHYLRKSLTGDHTITARVTGQTNTDYWAKAGVMFRESAAANSPFVMVIQMPNGEVAMQWRDAAGGSANWSGTRVGGATLNKWVRLIKAGNTFTGQYSTDGTNWTTIATHTTPFSAGSYLGGLAVTSHNNTTSSAATFTNVSVTTAAPPPFANGSFETTSANGFTYLPTGTGWTFAGNAGIQANGSAWGGTNTTAGTQTAFLQSGGAGHSGVSGSLGQTLTFTAAGTYTLSFQSALRGFKTGTTLNQRVGVYLNGTLVQAIAPTGTAWATFTVGLTVGSAGSHTIEFRALEAVGDTSLFLDDIRWV